jgi:hypothetical protein
MATDALITFKAGQCDVNVRRPFLHMFRVPHLMCIAGQKGQA